MEEKGLQEVGQLATSPLDALLFNLGMENLERLVPALLLLIVAPPLVCPLVGL